MDLFEHQLILKTDFPQQLHNINNDKQNHRDESGKRGLAGNSHKHK
jgi:hypothetical protein